MNGKRQRSANPGNSANEPPSTTHEWQSWHWHLNKFASLLSQGAGNINQLSDPTTK